MERTESSMIELGLLDLFSGSGAFSKAMEDTGYFKTRAFVENNPRCIQTLKRHWSSTPVLRNIKDVRTTHIYNGEDYIGYGTTLIHHNKIDAICGGFPCQDASTGNTNGKGIKGEKTGLWKEYKRLIEEIRPKYIIAENVPNLRNRGLGEVIQDLRSLDYVGRADIISARAFGALHQRERLFIVATHSDNYGFIKETYAKQTEDAKRKWESNRRAGRPFMQGFEWAIEPDLDRVVHEFPYGLDINTRKRKKDSKTQEDIKKIIRYIERERAERIKILGNAIYMPVVKWIANIIGEYENGKHNK